MSTEPSRYTDTLSNSGVGKQLRKHRKAAVGTVVALAAICYKLPTLIITYISAGKGDRDIVNPLSYDTLECNRGKKSTEVIIVYGGNTGGRGAQWVNSNAGSYTAAISPSAIFVFVPQAHFSPKMKYPRTTWTEVTEEISRELATKLIDSGFKTFYCLGVSLGSLGCSYLVKKLAIAIKDRRSFRPARYSIAYVSEHGMNSMLDASVAAIDRIAVLKPLSYLIWAGCSPVKALQNSIIGNLKIAEEACKGNSLEIKYGMLYNPGDTLIPHATDALLVWMANRGGTLETGSRDHKTVDFEKISDVFWLMMRKDKGSIRQLNQTTRP